jgi:hypothetical protein
VLQLQRSASRRSAFIASARATIASSSTSLRWASARSRSE